jgi:hypothetical protein
VSGADDLFGMVVLPLTQPVFLQAIFSDAYHLYLTISQKESNMLICLEYIFIPVFSFDFAVTIKTNTLINIMDS